ncbi:MAG: hypothetical protein AAGJ35_05195, partial [Myxococcota bacterium]
PATDQDPQSFCFQPCGSDITCKNVKDGRETCLALSPNQSICTKTVGLYEPCDIAQAIYCQQGLTCDQQTQRCRRPSTAPRLGRCGGNTGFICAETDFCSMFTLGRRSGFCLQKCFNNSNCPGGEICTRIVPTQAVCMPIGQRKEGESCGRADEQETLQRSRLCEKGTLCARSSLTNPDGICNKPAPNNCNAGSNNNPCGANRTCVNFNGFAFCRKTCSNAKDCNQGQTCTPLQQNLRVCTASMPSGPEPFGARCNPAYRCRSNLFCFAPDSQNATSGICTQNCVSAANCPSVPPGAECVLLGQNASIPRVCMLSCQTKACPNTLTCNAQNNLCQ